jgi:inhibitor of cysteine peptidase
MKHAFTLAILGIVCLFAVVFTGCVGSAPGNQTAVIPTETAVQVGNIVVNESQNTTTVYMNTSRIITVKLSENPTTGYQWNLTTTPGLRILNDTYIPSDSSGKLVGSGGTRTWDITTDVTGEQKIHAVYKRSWEQTAGNETTFQMTVMVI